MLLRLGLLSIDFPSVTTDFRVRYSVAIVFLGSFLLVGLLIYDKFDLAECPFFVVFFAILVIMEAATEGEVGIVSSSCSSSSSSF